MFLKSLLSLVALQATAVVWVVVDAAAPSNDRCVDVTSPLEPGVAVSGDTQEANFDYNSQGVCGSRSNERAIWYRIIGDGLEVTVSVCNENEVLTDFGVFFNCNDQLCLDHPPQQDELSPCSEGKAITLTFVAEEGEDYHIHVRGDTVGTGGGTEGAQFSIMYTQPETPDDSTASMDSLDSAVSTPTLSLSLVATLVSWSILASLWN